MLSRESSYTMLRRCRLPNTATWLTQRCRLSGVTRIPHPPMTTSPPPPGFKQVLFLEAGVGTDQHGQSVTKACVRACKDAISWNSIPSLETLVPGGRDNVLLRVQLAVPYDGPEPCHPPDIDLDQIRTSFAYGNVLPIEIVRGGARFESMCAVPSLGDTSDSWVMAIALVTIGY